MTLEQEIYQKLDTFTGDIKAFLKGSIHTTYKSSMHAKDLEFNTLEDNRLKIGFTTDHYSDPMFYINVDPETKTARVYNIETPGKVLSLSQANNFLYDFIDEMIRRKDSGTIKEEYLSKRRVMDVIQHFLYLLDKHESWNDPSKIAKCKEMGIDLEKLARVDLTKI